jgi:hypothetical protein
VYQESIPMAFPEELGVTLRETKNDDNGHGEMFPVPTAAGEPF